MVWCLSRRICFLPRSRTKIYSTNEHNTNYMIPRRCVAPPERATTVNISQPFSTRLHFILCHLLMVYIYAFAYSPPCPGSPFQWRGIIIWVIHSWTKRTAYHASYKFVIAYFVCSRWGEFCLNPRLPACFFVVVKYDTSVEFLVRKAFVPRVCTSYRFRHTYS